ncbi:MAG: ribbon-helix-helix protein, CopG family [Thermoanaerobaculia bacterium]
MPPSESKGPRPLGEPADGPEEPEGPAERRPPAEPSDGALPPERHLVGRHGGTTTVTPRMVRKTFWVDRDVEATLRRHARRSGTSESELFRAALRKDYRLSNAPDAAPAEPTSPRPAGPPDTPPDAPEPSPADAPRPWQRSDPRKGQSLRGRRGGRTTVTPALIRKTLWIDRAVDELLREEAYRSGRPASELVRRALRRFYDIE